ncbi:SprT-like domain-containing protein [Glaciecola siphonariae]|uniref:SprT-like domain-containing protein n=1 Tax=Glaciecola siphonariae TaxID=521012 RepID=A0ABV9LVJ3_9ALTE
MISTLQTLADSTLQEWMLKLHDTAFSAQPLPSILLNQRGRIAGAALLQKNIIKLHPKLFAQNQAYFISDVIPHELAHLVVFNHFGRVRPHGQQWRYVMEEILGVEAKVTHKLDVERAGVKLFDYYCECGLIKLSATRHKRVQSQKQRYICRNCKSALKPHAAL